MAVVVLQGLGLSSGFQGYRRGSFWLTGFQRLVLLAHMSSVVGENRERGSRSRVVEIGKRLLE